MKKRPSSKYQDSRIGSVELARRLGCSVRTAQRRIIELGADGADVIKHGRLLAIAEKDVAEYIARCMVIEGWRSGQGQEVRT